ncbi:hypothetical protein BHE74_00011326 [Ensete ventricosum]|nr:hypothetical protein BHE74_00011326 [Ensete ventricosum]RZS14323.1 hypothetical protein BHM03_00046003 [Ensete ventricosum]
MIILFRSTYYEFTEESLQSVFYAGLGGFESCIYCIIHSHCIGNIVFGVATKEVGDYGNEGWLLSRLWMQMTIERKRKMVTAIEAARGKQGAVGATAEEEVEAYDNSEGYCRGGWRQRGEEDSRMGAAAMEEGEVAVDARVAAVEW